MDINECFKYTSSGCFFPRNAKKDDYKNLVWVGSHDVREGLKVIIHSMEKGGVFLKKWKFFDPMFLVNYMETHVEDANFDDITFSRISKFPQNIKESMGIPSILQKCQA